MEKQMKEMQKQFKGVEEQKIEQFTEVKKLQVSNTVVPFSEYNMIIVRRLNLYILLSEIKKPVFPIERIF